MKTLTSTRACRCWPYTKASYRRRLALQNNGGWKRHIGRISQSILPKYRQKGIAGKLVQELVDVARMAGLQKVEAEFIDKQEGGQKLFALLVHAPHAP